MGISFNINEKKEIQPCRYNDNMAPKAFTLSMRSIRIKIWKCCGHLQRPFSTWFSFPMYWSTSHDIHGQTSPHQHARWLKTNNTHHHLLKRCMWIRCNILNIYIPSTFLHNHENKRWQLFQGEPIKNKNKQQIRHKYKQFHM